MIKLKVGLITLGCDKNRVDAEYILANLKNSGYILTNEPADSDIIIVNTCAFIDKAKRESIDVILEMNEYKHKGNCKLLIVTGCLSERYGKELVDSMPEADIFVPLKDNARLPQIIAEFMAQPQPHSGLNVPAAGRILTTPPHYAYLKIADGCDNRCTFCAIPGIRGKYRSENIETLVKSAQNIREENGTKELILVAQDITRYGYDKGSYKLFELLRQLEHLGYNWIRLLYCYPELVTEELIRYISNSKTVCKYIDIPLQHVSDNILKRMNRRNNKKQTIDLINMIRRVNDRIAIRSTFIVGFPGETEEDFNELLDFIKEYKLTHAGFFMYSCEDGTPAAKLDGQVPVSIKKRRLKAISGEQQKIVFENNKKFIGQTMNVLYEGIDYNKMMFYGRNEYNAPEIDTKVYFTSNNILDIGSFYQVKICSVDGYDLIGEIK